MGERESRDAARSLSVVHYTERDLDAAAELAAVLVQRSSATEGAPAFLVVLPTPDDALAFSESVLARRRGAEKPLIALTSPIRGRRIIASGASAIAGAPSHLARLVAESRLELSQLHTLVLVWPEETIADDAERGFLESVITEVPRSTERVAICGARTPELTQFLERSMWRAREIEHATTAAARATAPLRVIAVPAPERLRAVRSVLDAFDPESAVLLAFSDEGEATARDAAALLGSATLLQVHRGVPDHRFALGILFDDVPDAQSLMAAAETVDELIAIVRPSRLAALQKIATNTTPLTWTGALANARSAHDALRDEIRGYAGSGAHSPWIPIVEPLLETLDPLEVAAATLALLDRERRKAKRAAPVPAAAPAADRDVRGEKPTSFRPRPERREDERPSRPARRDDDRSSRPPRRDDRPSRPPRRDDERGSRPDRGYAKKRPWGADQRGAGGESRGPRGPRREYPDRSAGDRPAGERGGRQRDEIERVPRAAREGREWSERGERLRNSRRGPRGGEPG